MSANVVDDKCAGSGRGTDLASFRVVSGRWWGCCGACGGVVPITIDGRTMKHRSIGQRAA